MLILTLLIKEVNWIYYAPLDKNNDQESLLKLSIFCEDFCPPSSRLSPLWTQNPLTLGK